MRVADCSPARDASDLETLECRWQELTASKFVGGHRDLSADGHQGKTVAVTDGERSPGATPCEAAADRRFCGAVPPTVGLACCVVMRWSRTLTATRTWPVTPPSHEVSTQAELTGPFRKG
jgi:hypothetical protein